MKCIWNGFTEELKDFSFNEFGAIGSDLSVLSGFFDSPWHQPVAGLNEKIKGFILNQAGYDLHALVVWWKQHGQWKQVCKSCDA